MAVGGAVRRLDGAVLAPELPNADAKVWWGSEDNSAFDPGRFRHLLIDCRVVGSLENYSARA